MVRDKKFCRRRSKRNPGGLCVRCGERIFNRLRGSLYCLGCKEIVVRECYLKSRGFLNESWDDDEGFV